ncbi:hypothetical protein, partial [Methylobacterium radiotolerans]|uniref:hypothetical protein n=1 Tax=Methylobacterium radiotolerans TaxID=31998 RepID=UPI003F6622B4
MPVSTSAHAADVVYHRRSPAKNAELQNVYCQLLCRSRDDASVLSLNVFVRDVRPKLPNEFAV